MMKQPGRIVGYFFILICIALYVGCSRDDTGTNSSDGTISAGVLSQGLIVNHTAIDSFEYIPDSIFNKIKFSQKVFHGHTSYGGQITSGMFILAQKDNQLEFRREGLYYTEYYDDLGDVGDTSWTFITRMGLDNPSNTINVIVWSWEDGVSTNTVAGINSYLNTMSSLERAYPDICFIYMTGHLDGTGEKGNLRARNNQIRAYCLANKKILFDFADIESYGPTGVYYPDESSACDWCENWCLRHDCPDCVNCYHSHCYNCYRKAKAFWWMLAKLTGWEE